MMAALNFYVVAKTLPTKSHFSHSCYCLIVTLFLYLFCTSLLDHASTQHPYSFLASLLKCSCLYVRCIPSDCPEQHYSITQATKTYSWTMVLFILLRLSPPFFAVLLRRPSSSLSFLFPRICLCLAILNIWGFDHAQRLIFIIPSSFSMTTSSHPVFFYAPVLYKQDDQFSLSPSSFKVVMTLVSHTQQTKKKC